VLHRPQASGRTVPFVGRTGRRSRDTRQGARPVTSRRAVALGLERVGLQRPAWRMWEWSRTVQALPELVDPAARQGSDGLPLPPPILRVRVSGTARPEEFLAQGHRTAETLRDAVRRAGRDLEALDAVLDFGCGCGRVMRRWAGVRGPSFFGSDYNPKLVEWCRDNLPFGHFEVNGLAPPLPFADDQFDLVYALSVFTHLTEQLQHKWIAELRRVTKPGGLVLFTTRGEAWAWKLTPEERTRYDDGDLVVRYGDVTGTNLCAAFHPARYVHERLAIGFAVKASLAAGLADGAQDVHVVERTA
jgi:SAM-dependent methyltransferase